MNESFVFYRSFYEAINEVPEENQLELFKAICEYSLNNKLPKLENKISRVIFKLIKPNIDSAKARYERAVEGGKMGGRPSKISNEQIEKLREEGKTNKEIAEILGCSEKNIEYRIKKIKNSNPKNPKNLNVDVNVDDNVDVNGECVDEFLGNNPKNDSHTTPPTPTLDELRSYCLENGMEDFNYEKFYNHYESNGWINKNGSEIKNWKAKVRYWYKDDEQNGKLIKRQDTSRRLG